MRLAAPLIAVALGALAVRAEPTLSVRPFGVGEGLPHASIRRIVTDSTGFVWFCTEGGLARFDGSGFTSYGPAEGLGSRVVNDIVEDEERAVYWVATSAGLYRFERDRPPVRGRVFERVELPVGNSVRRLLLDSRKRLWIATTDGIAVLTHDAAGGPAQKLSLEPVTVFALAESADGAVWAGTQADGLFRIAPDGEVHRFPATHRGLRFIRELLVGPDGRIWCTYFGGVARLKASPERHEDPVDQVFETGAGVPSSDTTSLLLDREGGVLAGTVAGIARFARDGHGAWRVSSHWTMREGLTSDAVRALAFDPAGGLWIGTIARGAMKLVPQGFRRYPEVETSGSILVSLVPDGPRDVLALAAVAQDRYRLHRLSDSGATALDVTLSPGITYLGWGGPRLVHARDGAYWVATGSGLLRYDAHDAAGPERLRRPPDRRYGVADGLPGVDVYWIAEDARGTLWAAVADAKSGSGSLARLDPGARRFAAISDALAPSEDLPKSMVVGPSGRTWIGFWSGRVLRIEPDGGIRAVTFDPPLADRSIKRIDTDARGRLWILSEGARVADDPLAATVRLDRGPAILDGLQVNCAVEDAAHRMYFGTERGVFRVDESRGTTRLFTRVDGLPGDAVSQCSRDARGELWFADPHGVARLSPAAESDAPPPRARIEAIRIDGEAWPVAPLGAAAIGPIKLSPGGHRVAAQFFAIDHTPGERILFQHRLEGSGGWSPPSDARTLEFPRLGPGRHRLLVRAVQAFGAAAPPVSVDLLIPAPIWQRGWFVALVAGLLLAAASAAYRVRVGRLLAMERMRTRIATDLHDAVGADLSRISMLADFAQRDIDAQPARARTMLSEVARTARDAVREMSDIVWALQSKPADLSQILWRVRDYAAEVALPAGIALSVTSDAASDGALMGDERRRDLYLLLKEAVSNAIRHSGASALTVSVRADRRGIVAEVRDDGRGFAADAPPPSRGGRGIGNMRARAGRLGGTLTVTSAPDLGTTIRVELPSA